MSYFRSRMSVAITWGMIPLALWAGLPSTACLCANGQVKLVCQHLAAGHPAASHSLDDHEGHRHACCETREAVAESDSDHEADCCGGGLCSHGAAEGSPGIGSGACCKPILAAPTLAPKSATVPCGQAPAVVALVGEIGALDRHTFARDAVELDTGPPLDRVIVFRSLLI